MAIAMVSVLSLPFMMKSYAINANPDGIEMGDEIYKITGFFVNGESVQDYFYRENWDVVVSTNGKRSTVGQAILMVPPGELNSSMGRTFLNPKDLSAWAKAFNGNENYIKTNTVLTPIVNKSTKKAYNRYYVKDFATSAGSTVEVLTGANKKGYLLITTTPKPDVQLTVPSTGKVNEPVNISYEGEIFSPKRFITYDLYIDGKKETIGSGLNVGKSIARSVPKSFTKAGVHTIKVVVKDSIERETSVTKTVRIESATTPPPPPPTGGTDPTKVNLPPVADFFIEPSYYWVDNVEARDQSIDADGQIVSSEFTLDGQPSSFNMNFSRVTSPETHEATLTVVDDQGATNSVTKTFTINPTTPIAEFSIDGAMKVNRKITVDGTLSDKKSPVKQAPIDYSQTNWSITPVTAGLAQSDILIRNEGDLSKREFLVRKPGKYKITLDVTNKYGETSDPITKEITVSDDLDPFAQFTVNAPKVVRDKNNQKRATITLTDQSVSRDNDTIKQRIWYVEHDSNNDGKFGTPQDEPKQVISSGNQTTVQYLTDKVGNYRFSLKVIEGFGEPTLPEYIQNNHYRTSTSNVLDDEGRVSVYQEAVNFNIPTYDKSVEVINTPPVIDFGARRENKVDLVLDFGGMLTTQAQHLSGSAPVGGYYDETYYTFDRNIANQLQAYAATLESDFKAKGIDCKVTLANNYQYVSDRDGTCTRNIPVYDWVDHGKYEYSSYSGTSPYSGSWEVTSQSSSPITGVVWCYSWAGPGYIEHSHPPPCDAETNAEYGQVGTQYTASLRRWAPDMKYEVVNHYDAGCSYTEQVNTTDFVTQYSNQTYRSDADRMYVRFDKDTWNWTGNSSKWTQLRTKTQNENIFFWNIGTPLNRYNAENVIGYSKKGQFNSLNPALNQNIQLVSNYVMDKYMRKEAPENLTIVLGDKVNYTTVYSDLENDPELKREWKFTHDPTQVNGRVIDNQPREPIKQSGLYIDRPIQFTDVGTYNVKLRAMDDPLTTNDSRFYNYRKWSDEEVQRDFTIHVHRRPIADFRFIVAPTTYELQLDPSPSYDPDHQFNRTDRGIVETNWLNYEVDGVKYNGAPPTRLTAGKDYYVTLQVKDVDGAYGTVTKRISTQSMNLKPIAAFLAPEVMTKEDDIPFIDQSYDPNGDLLTDYQVTIRQNGSSTILKTLSGFPKSFASVGLGEGDYIVGLTVKDIPKTPPALQSDVFEQRIRVLSNRPPVSKFTLTPSPLKLGDLATYTDQSTDPDGDPLKNYSFTIERLDANGEVDRTWQTGVIPRDFSDYGVGKFKITQTVFDDPPSPLPSRSSSYTIPFEVVAGPQAPYAVFDYTPAIPYQGDNISLDPSRSYYTDGTITGWQWKVTSPTGATTTYTTKTPIITNAAVGIYTVTLDVKDNSGLWSKVPSKQTIIVYPQGPNTPPTPAFTWNPFLPSLGDTVQLNAEGSFDVDGVIASYSWSIKNLDNNSVQSATGAKPSFTALGSKYAVTLTVKDNKGASASLTKNINVNIAKLKPLVTHTDEWKVRWIAKGYSPDINKFYAGEKFVITLKTTPAAYVTGKVDFGGKVGTVDLPKNLFQLASKSQFEYVWKMELWSDTFKSIPRGEYRFSFNSFHPINSPYVQATESYIVDITDNIFSSFNFHRVY
ncbi:PKD domain-containing protein [Priestia koreensis]|uniref:PKD domain-containing protein n=1 Tax=Priestia koreensis TaxID=284581 RepID=UPI0020420B00|nr:PKD domain-containing protein [Priestia koreensis]MCM3005811.1 PKD domain-containing protein [Priestia koreensis]